MLGENFLKAVKLRHGAELRRSCEEVMREKESDELSESEILNKAKERLRELNTDPIEFTSDCDF